jgi:hypothetical protein
LSADGFTINELREWHARQQEEMRRILEQVEADEAAATQAEQESRDIFWSVREMLEASGQNSETARANAAQMTALFSVVAQRSGGQYTPRQLWDRYAPDLMRGSRVIRAGEVLPATGTAGAARLEGARITAPEDRRLFHAAMYRSKAETVQEFIDESIIDQSNRAKPFFHLRNDFGDTIIELGADQARHIREGHPDFTEWDRIPEAIEKGEQTSIGKNMSTGTDTVSYILPEGESALVVIAAPDVGGKGRKNKPTRTVVLTAFKGKAVAVEDWTKNRKAASPPVVSQATPHAKASFQPAPITDLFRSDLSEEIISQIGEEVNILLGKDKTLSQYAGERSTMSIDPAYAALQRDVDAWGGNVDEFFADPDKHTGNIYTMLGHTPLVMRLLNIPARKITISGGALTHIKKDHIDNSKGMSPEILKKIPKAMTDPLMILESASQPGRIVVVIDLKDNNGATVIVPIALDAKADGEYAAHTIPSVYGRAKGEQKKIPDSAWFTNQVKIGNLRYWDKKRSLAWARTHGVQFPSVRRSVEALSKREELPKSERRVKTKDDLDLARQQNSALYQDRMNAPGARGSVHFDTPSGRPLIELFETSDASTFLHESGHVYLEMLRSLALEQDAAPEISALWAQAKQALGATTDALTRNLLFDMAVAHGVIQYGNQPDPDAGVRQYTSELSRAGKPRPSLLTGEGWNQRQLDAVLDHMEQKHWNFVQGIWNYIGTFKDQSFALQRDLTGAEKAEVAADFKKNPKLAQAWAAVYGGNVEYGMRGFFKAQMVTGIGKRRRPPEAAQ